MAVTSGFFDAELDTQGAPDRLYNSEQFGAIFDGIITDGIFEKYPSSVYDSTNNVWEPFKIAPPTDSTLDHLEVNMNPGRAWFNGTWTLNDDIYAVTLDDRNATLGRVDGIYIKVDKDLRINSIYVSKGENATIPVMTVPSDNPGHVYYHLIAKISIPASGDYEGPVRESDITNMINVSGGSPYATSNVTDPNITTQTILDNLESQFDSYQSRYGDQFEEWFNDIKDSMGGLTADQIVEISQMVAETYCSDYLSGGFPYVSDDCLYLSSSREVPPEVSINFGFVSTSMSRNEFANELTVYTENIGG